MENFDLDRIIECLKQGLTTPQISKTLKLSEHYLRKVWMKYPHLKGMALDNGLERQRRQGGRT